MSKNSAASDELLKAEKEYYGLAGQFIEQGPDIGPDNTSKYYVLHMMRLRRLIMAHFSNATDYQENSSSHDLADVLPSTEQAHLKLTRMMAWADIQKTQRKFLPNLKPEEDTFSFGNGESPYSFKIKYRQNERHATDAITTARIVGDEALVCLTHLPGSVGASPMNAVESTALEIVENYFFEFSPENVRFFIHVPPECAANHKEMFVEAVLQYDKKTGYHSPEWIHYEGKPRILDESILEHFSKPEELEQAAWDWAQSEHSNFRSNVAEETHAAQVIRSFHLRNQLG